MNNRFVVLTGHLNDYPLPDLIGILRHQQKTGRLLIEYPKAPASFFFEDGGLIDVQLDGLVGLQAICVAMAEPVAPFNFNPLIRSSQRSLDTSLQKVVSELFGCWDETPLLLDTVAIAELPAEVERPAALPPASATTRAGETLALPAFIPSPPRQTRTILAMAAAGLLLLGISSLIAVSGSFQTKVESVSLAASSNENLPRTAPPKTEAPPVASTPVASTNETNKTPTVTTEPPKVKGTASLSPMERRKQTRQPRDNQNSVTVVDTAENSQPTEQVASDTTESKPDNNERSKVQLVDVVMRIENGRVLQAAIANHKAGMDGYEALALRIARQRRYSAKTNGHEIVTIRVTQPD